MKRARSSGKEDPFPFGLLGKNKKAPARRLALVTEPKELHTDLLAFLGSQEDAPPVELALATAGPYLSWPEIAEDSKKRIRELMPVGNIDADYELAGLCEPICVLQCAELCKGAEGDATLSFLGKMKPGEQLEFIWEAISKAGLNWQSKEKDSRFPMWNSGVLAKCCKTLRHVNEHEPTVEKLLIGHSNFEGTRYLKLAMSLDGYFVMPLYLVNYCLDEKRHELHVIGAVLTPEKKLLIVDPNGVVPEDFGEPNVVMVSLPWTAK